LGEGSKALGVLETAFKASGFVLLLSGGSLKGINRYVFQQTCDDEGLTALRRRIPKVLAPYGMKKVAMNIRNPLFAACLSVCLSILLLTSCTAGQNGVASPESAPAEQKQVDTAANAANLSSETLQPGSATSAAPFVGPSQQSGRGYDYSIPYDGLMPYTEGYGQNAEVVDETDYYKVIRLDSMYYCFIYDENHDVVTTEGRWPVEPGLTIEDSRLVKLTYSAGPSRGLQWGYYYDTKADVLSRTYYYILDEKDGKVAYGGLDKLVVRDIFDKAKYYKEFTTFKLPLSKMVDPITSAEFTGNGNSIKVTYLSGDDYREVSEVFDLG